MTIDLCGQELDSKQAEQRVTQMLGETKQPIQTINLSSNKLQQVDFIGRLFSQGKIPQLRILLLNQNFIQVVDLQNITSLLTLDVSQNPIKDFKLQNCSIKSLTAQECGMTDQLLAKLLRETKIRHFKLQQNKITNKGLDALVKDKQMQQQFNENLLSLDLKQNPTELQSLLQIKNKYFQKQQQPLPAIQKPGSMNGQKPGQMNSQINASKPGSKPVSKQVKQVHTDVNSLIKQMGQIQAEKQLNWPQALVAVLVGVDHMLVQQAAQYCGKGVCGALTMGIKCQPDIEEICAQNFVRKCGTVYCKDLKTGNGLSCQQRCEAVLQTLQKTIDKQTEEK